MTMKIGYIGTGSMGSSHVETFRDFCADQATGVGMFDPHAPSAEKAKALVPDMTVYDSAQALLASDIDAVVISTPNFTHLEYTLAALAAGKHVFAEKPVATSVEDCRAMVQAAKDNDRVLFIGHELRYAEYFQKIKDMVDDDIIGTVQIVWCHEYRGPFMEKVNRWIVDGRYSGGAIVDKNGHHFDLMNWWVGSRPKKVSAFGSKKFNTVLDTEDEVLDNASVCYEYENGVVGNLMLSMFAPGWRGGDEVKFGLIGDKGLLETQIANSTITVWPREGEKGDEQIYNISTESHGFGGHTGFVEEHIAFIEACRTGKQPLTDVRECVDATLLAIAAEKAVKQGCVVEVE
jgi:predicted dehydrogenase